jgi:hypothetical protein
VVFAAPRIGCGGARRRRSRDDPPLANARSDLDIEQRSGTSVAKERRMTTRKTCLLSLALPLFALTAACSAGSTKTPADGTQPDGSTGLTPVADGGAPPTGGDASTMTPEAQAPVPTPATFLTLDTGEYLTDGDGGVLLANAAAAGARETFALTDLNGGSLASGDPVLLASAGAYLTAADGGALAFDTTSPGDDQTFFLVLVDGGAGTTIAAGDHVALRTKGTGDYVSAINGGGGQVLADETWDRAWETYTLGLASPPGVDAGTPPAVTARQKVLAFLQKISGNHTLVGVEDKAGGHADSDQMASMGNGQRPSFWSADWGFGSAAAPGSREGIVQEGKKQWGAGAIVQYIYHACPLSWGSNEEGCDYSSGTDPIDGSCGDLSDAQWTDLTTPGGTLNGVWLARLDKIAAYFQELKAAGIAPLFRPLHEINGSSANNGCWAWWQGRPGPTGSAALYQITHDYLANTKGLDNIIWVYNLQDYTTLASDVSAYSPGASYFDVAALDIYDVGYTTQNYQAMIAGAHGKPIGVAECEFLPDPSTLAAQPLWAYAVVWPDFLYPPHQNDNTAQIPALFADSQVITLSQMPGW